MAAYSALIGRRHFPLQCTAQWVWGNKSQAEFSCKMKITNTRMLQSFRSFYKECERRGVSGWKHKPRGADLNRHKMLSQHCTFLCSLTSFSEEKKGRIFVVALAHWILIHIFKCRHSALKVFNGVLHLLLRIAVIFIHSPLFLEGLN